MNDKIESKKLFKITNWSDDGYRALSALLDGPIKRYAEKFKIPGEQVDEWLKDQFLPWIKSVALWAIPEECHENLPSEGSADYALGLYLLGLWVTEQASVSGYPTDHISKKLAQRVGNHLLTLEANSAKDAALEKALHKAAGGDFIAAGKLFRELFQSRVRAEGTAGYAKIGMDRLAQQSNFGKLGVKNSTIIGEGNRQKVLEAANIILATRKKKITARGLVKLIIDEIKIPESTARGHVAQLIKEVKIILPK